MKKKIDSERLWHDIEMKLRENLTYTMPKDSYDGKLNYYTYALLDLRDEYGVFAEIEIDHETGYRLDASNSNLLVLLAGKLQKFGLEEIIREREEYN